MCFKKKEKGLEVIDYSNPNNWGKFETKCDKDVDVFFVSPTIVDGDKNQKWATIEQFKEKFPIILYRMIPVFEKSCNVFSPLYRQCTNMAAFEIGEHYKEYLDLLLSGVAYQDVAQALDFYFQYQNHGKPFILAGHSQGSGICIDLLTNYFQKNPQYLKRMVACYCIGFAPSVKEFKKYPNLKLAKGETDTNVIISYTTEGPNADGPSIFLPEDPYVINPINWKTDDTYADAKDNLGSYSIFKDKAMKIKGDAQINLKRKTVVCTTNSDFTFGKGVFSSDSLHAHDYGLYYYNLQDNIQKRINNFKK